MTLEAWERPEVWGKAEVEWVRPVVWARVGVETQR